MKNKLFLRILACLLAGASAFSFVGCKHKNNNTNDNDPPKIEGPGQVGGDPGAPDDPNGSTHTTHFWSGWKFTEDGKGHYKETTCTEHAAVKAFEGNHVDVSPADGKCDVCEYVMSTTPSHTTHTWSDWKKDENGHYKETTCTEHAAIKDNEGSHVDASPADGKCDVCDYVMSTTPSHTTHTWSDWKKDEDGHYKETTCTEHAVERGHEGSHADTNPADGKCDVCDYLMSTTPSHTTHTWSDWKKDEEGHYKETTCTEHAAERGYEGSHVDIDPDDGKCDVCEYVMSTTPAHTEHTWSDWKKDENGHYKETTCTEHAAERGYEGSHVDTNPADGKCDVCDYVIKTDPDIENKPVAGAVEIIKASGDLESAYVTWKIDSNAKWYHVYVKASSASGYSAMLDAPLVRKYSTYFRADAVGLAKGTYDFKVVPLNEDGTEATDYASEAKNVSVEAHMRVGFAFVNGTSSGAYNEDGTLKSNANVIYITDKTKDTVELDVVTNSKGATTKGVGLLEILKLYKKNYEQKPLDVRFVGNVTDMANIDSDKQYKGDICVDSTTMGVTLEGIGSDATANGWGVRLKNVSNVEVRNLGFMNCNSDEGDNIGLQQGNNHVWVHNCDLFYGHAGSDKDQVKGDGALDTKDSTYVTHSFNHFWDSGKCNLLGVKGEKETNYITYHHNWYDHSDSRHPRIRTASVHIFNNYFDGNSKYGVGVTKGASAFVENNYFRSTAMMRPMLSSMQGTDILDGEGTFSSEDGGIIKSIGNTYDSPKTKLRIYSASNTTDFDCYEATSRGEKVPDTVKTKQGGTGYNNFDTDPSIMYEYEVETAEQAKATVQKYAGRVDGGDLKYEFNNATEDSNYEVIADLKAMVTNYKGDVVAIGGDPEGAVGGNTPGGNTPGGNEGGDTTDPDDDDGGDETPEVDLSGYGQYLQFTAKNIDTTYAKDATITDGDLFSASINKAATVTEDKSTAVADDNSGLNFDYGIMSSGSGMSLTVTANQKITITIYYCASDGGFPSKDQSKAGNLSWKIDGGSAVSSTKTGKKDNKVAYSETITLEAGQEVVFSLSEGRFVLFGLFANVAA